MVNAKDFRIPNYVCAALVKELSDKKFTFIGDAVIHQGQYDPYFKMKIQVAETKKVYDWVINKDTNQAFSKMFGEDTLLWVGKTGTLMLILNKKNMEQVVGVPV